MTDHATDQDMDQVDKPNPTLMPTHAAQDTDNLNKIIVPMPSFTNPNNPDTASGSINYDIETHPVRHSDDFGADVTPGVDPVASPMDTHGLEQRTVEEDDEVGDWPEDREEWLKKHWQAKAVEYGLAKSGNLDEVRDRVEEYEADQAQ
jgi:hypothetical protein